MKYGFKVASGSQFLRAFRFRLTFSYFHFCQLTSYNFIPQLSTFVLGTTLRRCIQNPVKI